MFIEMVISLWKEQITHKSPITIILGNDKRLFPLLGNKLISAAEKTAEFKYNTVNLGGLVIYKDKYERMWRLAVALRHQRLVIRIENSCQRLRDKRSFHLTGINEQIGQFCNQRVTWFKRMKSCAR